MKNKLSDLNDHLFAQLERLSDETLSADQVEHEAKRCEAMVSISDQVLRITALQLQAAKIAHDSGANPIPYLPPAPTSISAPPPPPKLAAFPPFKVARE